MDPSNRTLKKDSGRKLQVFLAGHIHGYENKQHCRTKIRRILNKYNVASYDAWEEEEPRNEFAVSNWEDERYYADSKSEAKEACSDRQLGPDHSLRS